MSVRMSTITSNESWLDRLNLGLLPKEVWIVSAATFLNRSVGFLALYATVFYKTIGLGPSALSMALFAAGAAGVAGSLVGGWAAGRFGSAEVLIAGSVLNVPLLFVLGAVSLSPFEAVTIASASVAVTQSFGGPAAALVTGSGYRGSAVTVVAFYRIFLSTGVTVAPIIVAVVGEGNYAQLFLLSSLGSASTAVLLWWERPRLCRVEKAAAPTDVGTDTATGSEYESHRIARLWAIVLVFGTAMGVYAQYSSGIPLAVEHVPRGAHLYGVLIIVNSVFIIVFELPLSLVVAKLKWNYMLGLGVFVTGAGLALCGIGTNWTQCVIGFVIFSFGEALFMPLASASIANISSRAENPRYQGYLAAAQAIGFAVGPGIGAFGFLHEPARYWMAVVLVSLAASLAAVLAGITRTRVAPVERSVHVG